MYTQMQGTSVAAKQSVHGRNHIVNVWARDEGQMFAGVHVFGNSRNPGTLLKVSLPQGRTVGNMIRTGSKNKGLGPL